MRTLLVLTSLLLALVAAAPAEAGEPTLQPTDWLALHIHGDFRFRNEFDLVRSTPEAPVRYRMRLRGRLGIRAVLAGQLEIGFRLVTGAQLDANSGHQSADDGFGKLEVDFDRAYARWKPRGLGGSYVMAGKYAHPFTTRPVFAEQLWDEDVHPFGVTVAAQVPIGAVFDSWTLVGGLYLFAENSNDDDGLMPNVQTSFHFAFGDVATLVFAQSLYAVVDPVPGGDQSFVAENQGNALVDADGDGTPDGFAEDFLVLDSNLGFVVEGPRVGVEFGAQLIANAAASTDAFGFGVGVGVPITLDESGRTLTPWLDYHHMGREAVFSPLATDDHQTGATNLRGLAGGLTLAFARWGDARAYVLAEQGLDDDPGDLWATRVRSDFNFRF